jgi:hypothetical protein
MTNKRNTSPEIIKEDTVALSHASSSDKKRNATYSEIEVIDNYFEEINPGDKSGDEKDNTSLNNH